MSGCSVACWRTCFGNDSKFNHLIGGWTFSLWIFLQFGVARYVICFFSALNKDVTEDIWERVEGQLGLEGEAPWETFWHLPKTSHPVSGRN